MITIVIVKPHGIIHIAFRVHALSNVIKMLATPLIWRLNMSSLVSHLSACDMPTQHVVTIAPPVFCDTTTTNYCRCLFCDMPTRRIFAIHTHFAFLPQSTLADSHFSCHNCPPYIIACPLASLPVTGEGHKTQSILKRGLSRVEINKTISLRTLELRVVLKLKQQLDCPQKRRRLNLGSP